jgi:hypothetical protein
MSPTVESRTPNSCQDLIPPGAICRDATVPAIEETDGIQWFARLADQQAFGDGVVWPLPFRWPTCIMTIPYRHESAFSEIPAGACFLVPPGETVRLPGLGRLWADPALGFSEGE